MMNIKKAFQIAVVKLEANNLVWMLHVPKDKYLQGLGSVTTQWREVQRGEHAIGNTKQRTTLLRGGTPTSTYVTVPAPHLDLTTVHFYIFSSYLDYN